MRNPACKWLLAASLAAFSWDASAQPRETTVVQSSEDALRVWMTSANFRLSAKVFPGGVDEPSCAAGALKTMRDVQRIIGGRMLDGTTVAGHTARSLMLVMCLETGAETQAHVIIASDDTTEASQLMRLAEGFARMSRMTGQPAGAAFDHRGARQQAGHVRNMSVQVGYKARRVMPADRCMQEARQAMANAGLRREDAADVFIIGTGTDGIAVAVCAPGAGRTAYRLAAFGNRSDAAVRLLKRVTDLVPGRPGEKPEMHFNPGGKAGMVRNPNP